MLDFFLYNICKSVPYDVKCPEKIVLVLFKYISCENEFCNYYLQMKLWVASCICAKNQEEADETVLCGLRCCCT